MNKQVSVKIAAGFEARVAQILRLVPGFVVDVDDTGTGQDADIVVSYDDNEIAMIAEVKMRANAATAHHVVRLAESYGDTPLLFVAGETTEQARDILRESGIAFVDELGNAELELPGLILRILGANKPKKAVSKTRLSGKAGRVVQALLLAPERGWHVNELAAATDVSAGFVHRVVARLTDQDLMAAAGTGPSRTRQVTNPGALLDLWAEEQVDKVSRTHCYQLAQTQQQLLEDLSGALDAAGIEYAVTGMAGADLITPLLTAIPETDVWVKAIVDPADLIAKTPCEAVTSGHNITFLQANNDDALLDRQRSGTTWIANNLRLYLDLLNDPRRGPEQAAHLREHVIGF